MQVPVGYFLSIPAAALELPRQHQHQQQLNKSLPGSPTSSRKTLNSSSSLTNLQENQFQEDEYDEDFGPISLPAQTKRKL